MRVKHILKLLSDHLSRAVSQSLPEKPGGGGSLTESPAPYFIEVADRAFDELKVSLSGRISLENAELVQIGRASCRERV